MSLILEALKKSEAERQLGRAPGLSTPMPVRARKSSAERLPLAWFALGALLFAGGGAWWLLASRPTPKESPATPEQVVTASHSTPATTAPLRDTAPSVAMPSAAPPQAAVESRPRRPAPVAPVAPALRDSPAPEPETVAPLPRDPEFASTERESVPIEAALPPPPVAAPAPPPVVPVVTPSPAPETAAAAAGQAPAEALPRLDQLGGPQRDALPPLKQTMHVYAEQPAERFVLIDGHRYREGDRLAANLQLSEIRRDGTVFVLDGLRFLLPRP
jgi:general secretion pathway protein B